MAVGAKSALFFRTRASRLDISGYLGTWSLQNSSAKNKAKIMHCTLQGENGEKSALRHFKFLRPQSINQGVDLIDGTKLKISTRLYS